MSLGYKTVREALVKEIVAIKDDLGIQVFWENRESAQLDKIGESFMTVDIDFNGGSWEGIGSISNNVGVLVLTHYTKVGGGVVDELEVADKLTGHLAMRVIENGTLALGAMAPGPKGVKQGWRTKEWMIPFNFYA